MPETSKADRVERRQITHWIAGEPVLSTATLPVLDPATGQAVAEVCAADSAAVRQVVEAAAAAWPAWRDTPAASRARVLSRWALLLRDHRDELADLITSENGKTRDDAYGEIDRGVEALDAAASGVKGLKGEVTEQTGTNIDTSMAFHPLGVCVGITPFNFPVMVPLAQASFAVAAGNSFVCKPSEQDPGPTLLLAKLAVEAGLPPGIFNVINGRSDVAEQLIEDPDVRAIAFVGSTPVARRVYAAAAAAGKRVQAFGGAKNHLVVMPDAQVSAAADALISAAFGSAGQRCMAITTAVAVGDVADELITELAQRAKQIRVGAAVDAKSEMGPLISESAQQRVRQLVADAIDAGAVPVVDRSAEQPADCPAGYFAGPTVLDDVTPAMEVYKKEVFGPVLGIVRVETLEQAIELIEKNPFGNGSAIFTRSGHAARTFQRTVSTGMVGVNIPIPVPVATYGFAGWKASAFGDTGLHDASWRFYTRPKYTTSRWDDTVAGIDLGFRPN
ncbi:CoA-acylating methylmalonate-semialdehyde dehydrogenase [Nocardia asiatica]|uniref:CoA-acylating methylmalonate-semialdehyde dehydrogenase n=1 Tax=Nocardia asiatica TaxID=209252 RepID=UPI0006850082|nr:CoA-acylating methylmalonate-semialdehyde dehydrogenase [Nocardia asiatica]